MNKYKQVDPNPIDQGGSFRTVLAKRIKTEEKVIFKIPWKNYFTSDECKGNKEVQINQALAQVNQSLHHKNVLKMLEFINDSNELLMVFDYFPDNVKSVMQKRGRPLTEMETKPVMLQVFQGLSYIHEKKIMHRNLRPEVLLCDKDMTSVKISDFSMAKFQNDQLGTYEVKPKWYQSPEVLLESTTYTEKIDCWAAGCIMGELLLGKTLMPGTSDRDQMKLICELIGLFKPHLWPEGTKLRRAVSYSLPKDGKGLSAAGIQAGSDAKGLIMECLEWNPDKRISAVEATLHTFFKSDGEFTNVHEQQDTMRLIGDELSQWNTKWGTDISKGPASELQNILDKLYQKRQYRDRNSNTQAFAGFEKSNPLIGIGTPRDKKFQQRQQQEQQKPYQQPYQQQLHQQNGHQQQVIGHQQQVNNGNGYEQTRDDSFQLQNSNGLSHQPRTYPLDTQFQENQNEKSHFEDYPSPREEKQSRQETHGGDQRFSQEPIFSTDGHMSPPRQRRNNESPRRKHKDQIGALGGDLDEDLIKQEQTERKKRADKLFATNRIKYETIYGRSAITGDFDQPKHGGKGTPQRSRRANNDGGQTDDQKQPIRSRQQNPANGIGRAPEPGTTLQRMNTSDRIFSKKTSEQSRLQNRERGKYGDPFMSQLIGQRMPPKMPPQTSQSQSNFEGGYGDHQAFEGNGKYTPSWSADNQMRTH